MIKLRQTVVTEHPRGACQPLRDTKPAVGIGIRLPMTFDSQRLDLTVKQQKYHLAKVQTLDFFRITEEYCSKHPFAIPLNFHCGRMDPGFRVDLFISYHGSEKLSPGFTMRELAAETEKVVRSIHNTLGIEPFIFFESTSQHEETVDAVLQTRSGGLALFLLTPAFFEQPWCIAELRAFLEVSSDSNVKLLFVCVESSADSILSIPLVKRLVPSLSQFKLLENIPVTSIQETSANLSDAVFRAWECTDGVVATDTLPTIYGHTREMSFLALQRVFTNDDLPAFRAILSLHMNLTNMLDAFSMARKCGAVTIHNVRKLHDVIRYRYSPAAEAQSRMVKAYERKWGLSDRLSWRDEVRQNLLCLFENNQSGATQGSSSRRPPKQFRETETAVQETTPYHAKRSREATDLFNPYFVEPPQSGNIVLDFQNCDGNGNPVTAEGRLLRKVLELSNIDGGHGVSAFGKRRGAAHGMGGVGKTTALRALCYEDQVKQAYPDGIWFLEFGEDADDRKMIDEVAQCVRGSGGGAVVQEMNETRSLSEVLKKGAAWLRDRTVLLVCDDLWGNENQFGYLPDLTKLVAHAPKSRLVISTRDRKIAISAGGSVEFAPLVANDNKARNILLSGIEGGADISDEVAEDNIRRILKTCAGLPLALAIAARGLEEYLLDSSTTSNGIRLYCEYLEQDSESITVEELEHYPGLNVVINSSLSQCQKWGTSDLVERRFGRKLDMISMFKGLCVLEKQMALPKRVLMHVWGLNDKCTDEAMKKFANSNLASRVETGESTQREFGLRLHDLVLVLCQRMAKDESAMWHKRIVDAYEKNLSGDRNCEDREQGEKSLTWWDTYNDGYVFAHLSRHLALSGQSRELKYLLCDIRWTMRRLKYGEWSSLDVDFKNLFSLGEHAGSGMRQVHKALKGSWPYAHEKHDVLAFYIFAHFTAKEREERDVARLLSSIDREFPKPWLRPMTKCVPVSDRREVWKAVFSNPVNHVTVDWTSGNVFAVSNEVLFSWSASEQCILWESSCSSRAIALSNDGKVIVSGSSDHTIRYSDAQSGAPIGDPLHGHEADVSCVVVSNDGKVIVSGSWDNSIRRWDAQTRAPIGNPLIGHEGPVRCVAVSNDGKVIVSGSYDRTIRRWDAQSGAPIGDPLHGHKRSVECVTVSNDGKVIVSGSDDTSIRRWDAQSGAPTGDPLIGHEGRVACIACIAVSNDRNVIVSGSYDNSIRLWDAQSGAPIGDPLRGHESFVMGFAVSSDGKAIVSGSFDSTIRHWDLRSEAPMSDSLRGHERQVDCVAGSCDENETVSGPRDIAISHRNAPSDSPNGDPLIRHENGVVYVCVSDDGKLIVSGSSDSVIQRWNAQSGAPIGDALIWHESALRCVTVSNDGKVIVSGAYDGTIMRWDAQSGDQIGNPISAHEGPVYCVAISNDGKVILSGSWDKSIRRWDVQSGAPIGGPLHGHEGIVRCAAVSNDGKVIVSGSEDKSIRRWDAQSGALIGSPLRGHEDYVQCIAVSNDGKVIVSGSYDGTIRRWDAQNGASIGDPLYGHEGHVYCVAVSFDRKVIVSFSDDNTVRWWGSSALRPGDGSAVEQLGSNAFEEAKLILPANTQCLAMDVERRRFVLGQRNGITAICSLIE